MAQMPGNAKLAMAKCGLCQNHLNEWSAFTKPNKEWGNIVCENLLISGRGVSGPGTIANTKELSDGEDNTITTITDVMNIMQMASNTNTQSVNRGINTTRQEMVTLSAEVQASRQVMMNTNPWMQPPVAPAVQRAPAPTPPQNWAHKAPPVAVYVAILPPTAIGAPPEFRVIPIAPHQQQQQCRHGRKGGHHGNAGRGRGMSSQLLTFGQQPPPANTQVQQGNQVGAQGTLSIYNYYTNWNIYISCGFNIPSCHTSKTFHTVYQTPNHHEGSNAPNIFNIRRWGTPWA